MMLPMEPWLGQSASLPPPPWETRISGYDFLFVVVGGQIDRHGLDVAVNVVVGHIGDDARLSVLRMGRHKHSSSVPTYSSLLDLLSGDSGGHGRILGSIMVWFSGPEKSLARASFQIRKSLL